MMNLRLRILCGLFVVAGAIFSSACDDDTPVDPSNPEAGPTKDAAAEAGHDGGDSGKDAARDSSSSPDSEADANVDSARVGEDAPADQSSEASPLDGSTDATETGAGDATGE